MFKQIKKLFIALVLVFSLCLVACGKECPECPECPTCPSGLIKPEECPDNGYIKPENCPACPEFDANKECPANGYIKPEECPEGIKAPTAIEFYSEDVALGESVKFEVEVTPADAYKGIIWSTSDPTIATVDAEGNITGVRPGKVTITARSAVNFEVLFEDEEVEVVEKGKLDFEIAEREKNDIVAKLSEGYVSSDFDLPTTWNQNAKVTYSDPNGKEITKFVMPDLGEATSQNYAITGSVTYGDSVSEFNVTLKLVKPAEGKNDYEKVNFAVEVAEAFLYTYVSGAEKVTENLYLPTSVYGVTLGWSTNKAYVLTNAGELTRPNNDTAVKYTITPKCGAASKSATFEVVAAGYEKDAKINYLLKDGVLKDINGKKFAGSVALPEKDDKFGIHLTYVSSDPSVIDNNGKISAQIKDTEVKFTVTAVYKDNNASEAAFVEVFEIKVIAAAKNTDVDEIISFADSHEQLRHVPYGANGVERTYVIDPVEGAQLKAQGYKFVGDENFKVNDDGSVELVTQYFRYHEAKLTVKYGEASYTWVINVGIGAMNDIIYIGGRSQSLQASANPAERGDMLQGFSKWDKYVGIVANNSERTVQQYWSEFSGYTMYVDVPTGEKEVVFTKDAEGNITATPSDKDAFVRQQIFFMEFATVHMDAKVMWADTNGDGKGDKEVYLPVVKEGAFATIRQTYGGNFGTLFVNESNKTIELPVSALSMGGAFADGVAMKTYTKSSISLAAKKDGKVAEIKDDYGSSLKVSREQTWAFDGYRPGFVVAPKGSSAALAEGSEGKYEFTYGAFAANANENNNGTVYIQYAVSSKLSALWGTPYVEVKQGGFAMAFHSQTIYSFAAFGGAYISGLDKSLEVTFARYFRHAENEELSDYVVADINAYLTTLVAEGADLAKVTAKDISFNDISVANLQKIENLKAKYDALYESWKQKDAVKEAGRRIDAIIAAAQEELDKQAAYANLTEKSFVAVRAELEKLADKNETEIIAALNSTEMDALVAAAKRNYNALTEGQKGLYDNGFSGKHLSFEAKNTSGIMKALEVETQIILLTEKVTDTAKVTAAKKAYEALKDVKAGTKEVPGSTSTAAAPVVVEVKANELISKWSIKKLAALSVAASILDVKADTIKINEAKAAYEAAADKDIIDKSFAAFGGVDNFLDAKRKEVEKAKAAELAADKNKTVELAKAIKEAVAALPTASQFEKGEFTADQLKSLKALVIDKNNKFDTLVALYKKLGNTPAADTVVAKIDMLVAGFPKTVEGKVVIDAEYGNFAGEGEKEILTKLVACPASYDKYAANLVIDAVENLPVVGKTTLEDEAAIKAARAAYKALTTAQKAIADAYQSNGYIPGRLTDLENKIEALKQEQKVAPIIDAVDGLPLVTKITLEDKAAIVAARKLVNSLGNEAAQIAAIGADAVNKLKSAENKIAELETALVENSDAYKAAVKAFKENTKVNGTITKDSKADAEALLAAYNAMNANEKAYFAAKFADYQALVAKTVSALNVYNQYAE